MSRRQRVRFLATTAATYGVILILMVALAMLVAGRLEKKGETS